MKDYIKNNSGYVLCAVIGGAITPLKKDDQIIDNDRKSVTLLGFVVGQSTDTLLVMREEKYHLEHYTKFGYWIHNTHLILPKPPEPTF